MVKIEHLPSDLDLVLMSLIFNRDQGMLKMYRTKMKASRSRH